MAKISIPEEVKEGFIIISEMKKNDLDSLVNILKNINSGEKLNDIEERLVEFFGKKSRILLQTIFSFRSLLDNEDSTVEEVAKNLSESFLLENEDLIVEASVFEENLVIILSNFGSLKKNINSRRSVFDNESVLSSTKLITDLRIIFEDDLSSKDRDAVIIHKLHVEYQNNFSDKELYLTLDLEDLNKLKSEIDRAIEKDQVIREDYKNNLNILF
ncbi:hypothetical protein [Flavobacterium sp. ACAM 123]|uniref:hypothetical protein n=1 Tax=Flavobacterium sp. ACAM 123 TaxID=1189620 RepID=UPI0002DBDD3A|nr:hypothetical protein [Flavobacterium sp. ACAM 123]